METIPEIISQKAHEMGFNAIEYIGEREGAQAFSAGCIDSNGEPIPMGLPTVLLLKGNNVEAVTGLNALDLL